MKAVILCAGEGKRLQPLTSLQPKALLPVANKPVIEYALENLRDAGCDQIGIVSNPSQVSAMAAALGDGARWRVRLEHLVQAEGKGIAAALRAAREFLGAEPFAAYLGDNLLVAALAPAADRFRQGDCAALLLLKEVPDPRAFGVAVLDGERVTAVVEKPAVPPSRMAICGVYFFTPAVWAAIARLQPSVRGELEITDAIAGLIRGATPVVGRPLAGGWHDIGSWGGYLAANRAVLATLPADPAAAAAPAGCTLAGPVRVGPGAVLERCRIRGPAVIGEGCVVRDASLGPFACLGAGVRLEGMAVSHSVLLPDAHLVRLPGLLRDAVVGPGAVLLAEPGAARSGGAALAKGAR